MILSPALVRAVRAGRKTTHRQPIRIRDGIVRPAPYKVGRDYAIQRAGSPRALDTRIEITSITRARLGDLTLRDARAEGHPTRAAFADEWMRTHDQHWPPTDPCPTCDGAGDQDCDQCNRLDPTTRQIVGDHPPGCTTCDACDGDGTVPAAVDDTDVLAAFRDHEDTRVWVIEFTLAQAPSLLTPAARPAGSVHGYTSNPAHAMRDEPEVITGTARRYGLTAVDAVPSVHDLEVQARSLSRRVRQDVVAAARRADPAEVARRLDVIHQQLAELDELRRAG